MEHLKNLEVVLKRVDSSILDKNIWDEDCYFIICDPSTLKPMFSEQMFSRHDVETLADVHSWRIVGEI